MEISTTDERLYELRPLLTTYAYNILGSLEEARDMVQDAFLKLMQGAHDEIRDHKQYLVRTVINLSINRKNRQKKMLASYPGEWLPEPVATESAEAAVNAKDVLSYSLMVLLEKLNPKQRAVFILKEAFDYDHDEIAQVLGISVENSRKLLSRAREQLQTQAALPPGHVQMEYLERYLSVIQQGDTSRLEQLLNEDITFVADGGGKVSASVHPIHGVKDVIAMLQGLHRKVFSQLHMETGRVNHQPAMFYYHEGALVTCLVLDVQGDRIAQVFAIRNPDKLRMLDDARRLSGH